jgi:type I restriction enzyme S subunit
MRPYMRAANVTWQGIDTTDVKEMDFTPAEYETYGLRRGDILLGEASGSPGEVGKAAIWRDEVPGACFQNTLIRVRPGTGKLVPFLHLHFVKDARNGRFAAASRGVGIHHLGAEALSNWKVVLPPLPEQHRIVEVIESYFTRLDDAVATLERAQRSLKRYRASVLKAAVEGRLVPTEAELARAEGRDYEPASVLLERILAERRRRWQEPGGRGKYEEPEAPDTTDLSELPEGWCWATVDALADLKGGITKGQKRSPSDVLREVPYLRVANVQRGRLDLSVMKTILATEAEIDELRLHPGDVLFNEGGDRDKLGRGWVWNGELPECIHQNHVFRARILTADLHPKFMSWYGNTAGQRYFFEEGKQTTNLASINLTKLRSLPVPILPLVEQTRIVEEAERLLSLADEAELLVTAGTRRCVRLRQSILKWAFEGRLADQDPSDEPASVLLERIRTETAGRGASAPTDARPKPRGWKGRMSGSKNKK